MTASSFMSIASAASSCAWTLRLELADEWVCEVVLADIDKDVYEGAGGGSPCSTFLATRNIADGVPRPLRGEWPPELFGLKDLWPEEKDQVRLGTLLAYRKAQVCEAMWS